MSINDSDSNASQGNREIASIPAGNRLPLEALAKIWGYLEPTCQDPIRACTYALVCRCFYRFFTDPSLWETLSGKTSHYILLQKAGNHNIWDSEELNDWYATIMETWIPLPPEIWPHRELVWLVMKKLRIWCAPSREEFLPHSNDLALAKVFIGHMPMGACFSYLSEELRGRESLALQAIKHRASAIMYCTRSLLGSRRFIKNAIQANASCLKFLGTYKEDIELVMIASRHTAEALNWARGQAKMDIDRLFANHLAKLMPVQGGKCGVCKKSRGTCRTCDR